MNTDKDYQSPNTQLQPLKKTCEIKNLRTLTPEGTLYRKLPDLCIDENGISSTREPLRHTNFDGIIASWDMFEPDMYQFLTSTKIRNAFRRTAFAATTLDPRMATDHPFMFREVINVADDTRMKDRWHDNVSRNGINCVIDDLSSVQYGTEDEILDALAVVPNSKHFGRTDKLKYLGAYDAVSVPSRNIPGYDNNEGVCMVGLYVAANEYQMSEVCGTISFQQYRTNEVFGMLADAMDTMGVKYGYITTYMQTIFVKKEERDGVPIMLFSPIIKHSDHTELDKANECMVTISLRLSLFFVLCIASLGFPRL